MHVTMYTCANNILTTCILNCSYVHVYMYMYVSATDEECVLHVAPPKILVM